MSTAVQLSSGVSEALILNGDLSRLTSEQKIEYVKYRCQSLGLDPAAKPFELLRLNGKEVLYATKACTEQLCESRKLSVSLGLTERIEDVIQVSAKVFDATRSTENIGVVPIGNLKGEALANALMKARTKAIRRAVLGHCGLGMLDESEIETIPNATKVDLVAPPASASPSEAVAPPRQLAGDFITPFGARGKGKKISDLTTAEIEKGIDWCVRSNKYLDWVDAARQYLKTADLPFDGGKP